MKKVFLLLIAGVLSASCSSDSDTATALPTSNREVREAYPQFTDLFASLYPLGVYVDDTPIRRSEAGLVYTITKVYNPDRTRILGYFEDVDASVVYYQHDAPMKTITMHSFIARGSYRSELMDVSADPVYASYGIDVAYTSSTARVFGWGDPYLSDDCVNGKRYWLQNKRFLGIRVNVRRVQGLDGEDMWAPCE